MASPPAIPTPRVTFTAEAADLVRRLTAVHGPVMFHQSGGCCDGSSPMCFADGEFWVGAGDVRLEEVPVTDLDAPVPFWMSTSQFDYWRHTALTIDVVPGRGGGFSLESPEGVRFLLRSRVFTDEEEAGLAPVVRGDEVDPVDEVGERA